MRPIQLSKALAAASANNICLSQTPGAAGNLTLNGTTVTGGVAVLDTQRAVLVTTAADESAKTLIITGTDDRGATISESMVGPNVGTGATTQNFKTVTQIAVSAAFTGAVTVGTNGVGSSPCQVLDVYIAPFATSLFAKVSGAAVNFTVQYTADDVFASTFVDGSASWTDHPNMTSKAVNTDSNLAFPASAVRLKINSGTGTVTFIIRQAGLTGV